MKMMVTVVALVLAGAVHAECVEQGSTRFGGKSCLKQEAPLWAPAPLTPAERAERERRFVEAGPPDAAKDTAGFLQWWDRATPAQRAEHSRKTGAVLFDRCKAGERDADGRDYCESLCVNKSMASGTIGYEACNILVDRLEARWKAEVRKCGGDCRAARDALHDFAEWEAKRRR